MKGIKSKTLGVMLAIRLLSLGFEFESLKKEVKNVFDSLFGEGDPMAVEFSEFLDKLPLSESTMATPEDVRFLLSMLDSAKTKELWEAVTALAYSYSVLTGNEASPEDFYDFARTITVNSICEDCVARAMSVQEEEKGSLVAGFKINRKHIQDKIEVAKQQMISGEWWDNEVYDQFKLELEAIYEPTQETKGGDDEWADVITTDTVQ